MLNATVLTIDLIEPCCMPPTFTVVRFARELQLRMWRIYPAEGGAEFVHGAAPVTRALMRDFCAEG
jgi:hypothetical protein